MGSGTQSACSNGSAYACYDYSPTVAPDNPCLAYGFAAFNGVSCGTCYQLTFTGTAQRSRFAEYAPVFSEMVAGFRWRRTES